MNSICASRSPALVGNPRLGYSGVLLRKTASQPIADSLLTGISWQIALHNIGGWITIPGTLVIVPAGIFRVRMFGAATWGSTLGTTHTIRYVINGTFSGLPVSELASSVVEMPLGSPVIDVVPGDTLGLSALHDGGVPVDILTTTTMFGVEAVR